MLNLGMGILALAMGPLIVLLSRRRQDATEMIDGFVVTSLLALALTVILPHAVNTAGFGAIGMAVLGAIFPVVAERILVGRGAHHQALTWMAMLGLGLHAFLDGGVLGHEEQHGLSALALGVWLHRVPVSMAIWERLPPKRALPLLLLLGIVTVVGFDFGEVALAVVELRSWGLVEGFVAGMLLHVAFEPVNHTVTGGGKPRFAAGIGALLALATLLGLSDYHAILPMGAEDMSAKHTFTHLALESAPPLMVGFFGAGLLFALLPKYGVSWLQGRSRLSEAGKGMIFGLPLPLCSCGVLPVYQSLWRSGAPAAAVLAFLIATPEIGVDAFLLSLALLGPELAWARVGVAAVVALLTGVMLAKVVTVGRARTLDDFHTSAPDSVSLMEGIRYAFGPLFTNTISWIIVGLGAATFLAPSLNNQFFASLPWGVDVVAMAILGFPAYVCAAGATPLAAVLLHKGMSAGAAVALLITGPATNITTVGVMIRLHGRRATFRVVLTVLALSISLGLLINATPLSSVSVPLQAYTGEPGSVLQIICLSILGALTLVHLVRVGPRGLLGEILEGAHEHVHDREPSGKDSGSEACTTCP